MTGRLPAHIEVAGLIRAAEAAGGFAMVVQKGEKDAGVIHILTLERGGNSRFWERMPRLDGTRVFQSVKEENPENKEEFTSYVEKRRRQDPDSWIVELDIAHPAQLIADWAG
ncbi:DUF1491 family protein [Qipengyuania sp.]|uniref:DUF1491 family protein n=1 Tax=Qipengyuania sp. TaxID=2004515 RepID=UPI0035C7D878